MRAALSGLAILATTACGRVAFDSRADGGGSNGDGDAAAGLPCNSIARLADDFEDGVQDPAWEYSFANVGTGLSETGGDVVVGPANNVAGAYAGYVASR